MGWSDTRFIEMLTKTGLDYEKNVLLQVQQQQKAMSEKEINAYRLTSLEEPTDEMLAYIMREVAEEAKQSNEEALEKFFDEISLMYQQQYGNN